MAELLQDDILRLETEAMQRELVWLMQYQLPMFLQQLRAVLKTAIRPYITQKGLRENDEEAVPATTTAASKTNPRSTSPSRSETTLTLTTPGDRLTGTLTVDGVSIVKAELKIKLARWNRGQTFRTTLVTERTWMFRQLQDTRNYLHLALSLVENFLADSPVDLSRDKIEAFLGRTSFLIKQAKDQLTFTDAARSSNYSALNRMIFYPALPDDIAVTLFVANDKVLVSVHALHYTALSQPNQMRSNLKEKPLFATAAGRTFLMQGQPVEVLDYVEVESHMEPLRGSLDAMNAAYDHCHWLLEKIKLFV